MCAVATEESQSQEQVPGETIDGTEALQTFVELEKRRCELEDEIKIVKELAEPVKEAVLRHMQDTGMQNVRINGRMVYLERKIWASAVDIEKLTQYEDTAPLVKRTVNTQSLSAWVRELDEDDNGMPIVPDDVAEAIKVAEVFKVKTKK